MSAVDEADDVVAEVIDENGTIPFEEALEQDEALEIDPNRRSILTEQGDPEIESLYHKRGRLEIQPDFQRQFVWDQVKSSRLIESALLRIPLPVVYLAQEEDGREQVIDGQQRLTAFFSFIDGKFPNGADFCLKKLKVFRELEGKRFSELSTKDQDSIRFSKIRTITFLSQSDSELKFEVFERLNTGAVSLNDQELRNCMYRGNYNNLLRRLSENEDFRYLLDIHLPDKRMKDVELVLRFAAFYHATYLKYQSPMRRFLNQDFQQFRDLNAAQSKEIEDVFKNAVSLIRSIFDTHAFKRFYRGTADEPSGRWEPRKFNSSLYDIMMWSFSRTNKNSAMRHADAIREAFIDLVANDDRFIDSIQRSTSSVQAVKTRFQLWDMRLQSVLDASEDQPRLFTLALKQRLYDNDQTCGLCGNRIQSLDDAAVDHIEQYWRGGKTIPENARLAHRYCNTARSRKD